MSVPAITKKVFPVNDASQDIPIFLRSKYFENDIRARQNHVESYVFRLLGDSFLKACFSDRPSPPMIVVSVLNCHHGLTIRGHWDNDLLCIVQQPAGISKPNIFSQQSWKQILDSFIRGWGNDVRTDSNHCWVDLSYLWTDPTRQKPPSIDEYL